jgi:hypothetical protein
MHRDTGVHERTVRMVVDLVSGPEVDSGAEGQRVDDVPDVGVTHGRERIAPEQTPRAHDATAGGGVAPQVPEVGGTFERDVAGRGQRSSSSMRMALPRTSLYTMSSGSPAISSWATFFVCGHVESVCG